MSPTCSSTWLVANLPFPVPYIHTALSLTKFSSLHTFFLNFRHNFFRHFMHFVLALSTSMLAVPQTLKIKASSLSCHPAHERKYWAMTDVRLTPATPQILHFDREPSLTPVWAQWMSQPPFSISDDLLQCAYGDAMRGSKALIKWNYKIVAVCILLVIQTEEEMGLFRVTSV